MKAVAVLLAVLVMVHAAPEKRFLPGFYDLPKLAQQALHRSQQEFEHLTTDIPNINFADVVTAMVPKTHVGMSLAVCESICMKEAGTILGPAASLANTVCKPVCTGAISKLYLNSAEK